MKKIKILIFAANPAETERLRLDAELREIGRRFRGSKKGLTFDVQMALAVQVSELNDFSFIINRRLFISAATGLPAKESFSRTKAAGSNPSRPLPWRTHSVRGVESGALF